MKLGLAKVERLNLGLSAGAVAASFALATPHFATSLALGAFVEAINFGAIHRGARALFEGEPAGARGWVGVFSMRFVLLALAIFMTLQAGADPVAFLIGLSLVMPATLIDAWIHRPPVIDPAELPVLFEEESEDDREYWESYSIWRPGRLLTSENAAELRTQLAGGAPSTDGLRSGADAHPPSGPQPETSPAPHRGAADSDERSS